MPGLLSAVAAKMAGMLESPSARGGVTHCLPRSIGRSVGRSAVVIGIAAPGILVLAARGFPGAVPPRPSDVYEGIVAVVSRHFASASFLPSFSASRVFSSSLSILLSSACAVNRQL